MKLSDRKSVEVYQKFLYAGQLESYASLCKTYQGLAEYAYEYDGISEVADPSKAVSEIYGSILEKASTGDPDITKSIEYSRLSKEERKLINDYSKTSGFILALKYMSASLDEATHTTNENGKSVFKLAPRNIKNFHHEMRKFNPTRVVDQYVKEHSRIFIGVNAYSTSLSSLETINEIDSEHIKLNSLENLTPENFGATITGRRSTRQKISARDEIVKNTKGVYKDNIPAQVGIKAEEKFHAAKGTLKAAWEKGNLKKILKKAGIVALAASIAIPMAMYSHNYLNKMDYSKTSDTSVVSQVEQDEISDLRNLIETLSNGDTVPTKEDLNDITSRIDYLITDCISDKVTQGIESSYSNLIVTNVQNRYDDTYASNSQPSDTNFIRISLHQKNNDKSYDYSVPESAINDPYFDDLMEIERALDSAESGGISSMYSSNYNYSKISDNVSEYLNNCSEYLNTIERANTLAYTVTSPELDYLDNGDETFLEKITGPVQRGFSSFIGSKIHISTRIPTKDDKINQEGNHVGTDKNTRNTDDSEPEL